MKFSDIPGLLSVKEKLWRSIESGKIAHAQMFSGSEGSANLAMALAYAALLNCTNRTTNDACGECASCQKINKFIHPDLHFVFPVSAAKNKTGKAVISDSFITEWRAFLAQSLYSGAYEWSQEFGGENKQLNISKEESRNILKKLALKSFEGTYKVMIIWLAEYMHPSAANALLKLLEEPPENTVFLVVTDDYEKIIGTILSRVQLLKIRPFKKEEVSDYLINQHNLDSEKAFQIASISSGNMSLAIRLINEIGDDNQKMFQEWMRICFLNNYVQMVDRAEDFFKTDKINQKGLFQYGLSILRESLLTLNGATDIVTAHGKEVDFINNFSKTLSLDKVQNLYQLMNAAFYHLERNGNPKIIFLDTSLQIASIFKK